MTIDGMHQIGEAGEAVGLSLRTIRHYEEVDLVRPSGRSAGGFRLYTDDDIERLRLVKRLKPLGFSLEDMHQVLAALDGIDQAASTVDADQHRRTLGEYVRQAEAQCARLHDQLSAAEALTRSLRSAASVPVVDLGRTR